MRFWLMLWDRVKRVVNIMVVSRMASTATRFRPRLVWNILLERVGIARKSFSVFMDVPPLLVCHNLPVLDADDPVGLGGNFGIVGNYHNGLMKLLAGHLEQADDVVAGLGVEVAGRARRPG